MFNIICINFINKIIKLLIKLHFSNKLCMYINDFKHYYIMKILNKYFKSSYNYLINDYYYNDNSKKSSKVIWTFWWQGIYKTPFIVKQCIKSIYKCSSKHKVIVITKYNYNNYIDIPDYILNKFHNGYISIPHFSDIIRFKLLVKYGGLWLDSTIYCNRNLGIEYFDNIYTCGGNEDKYHNYVSYGKWSSFLIGGSKNNDIFIFMNYFYELYWKKNNKIIDYFLMDYALNYIYKNNIGSFKTYVDEVSNNNNPHIHDLELLLNKKYNSKIFYNISKDTDVFKLTYKKELFKNKNNFYNVIINR